MRKIVALGVIAVLLSGCTPNLGTAAVVGDTKISVGSVQDSVSQIVEQRRANGPSENTDIASGQMAQDQLRFQIISVVLAKAASQYGVRITPSELDASRTAVVNQFGSEKALLTALTQNQIARKDFDLYLTDVLYQQKLGEKLVPGDARDRAVSASRGDAVNKLTFETLAATKITVNPRFGIFDPTSGMLTMKDFTNGAVLPRQ